MTTNQALATHNQVPIEVLAPEYPLDEEYYYNPALFYNPYWWQGGLQGSGYRRRPYHRPISRAIGHGGGHRIGSHR